MAVIKFNAAHPVYAFLSNMYPAPFVLDDRMWCSVEHYFQYMKLENPVDKKAAKINEELQAKLLASFDTFKARYCGSKKASAVPREDWEGEENLRMQVMRRAITAKFKQNHLLAAMLIATDGSKLIEESPWDDYWGNGKDGDGENHQGKLLTRLRKKLIEENFKPNLTPSQKKFVESFQE